MKTPRSLPQTTRSTGSSPTSTRTTSSERSASARSCRPAWWGSTRAWCPTPRRRSAASRPRASAARAAPRASTSTWKSNTSPWRCENQARHPLRPTPIIRPDLDDPLRQFQHWYEYAVAAGLPEPEAMALATATAEGVPSVRFVLLKGIDARGVEFFTNYESRKGRELIANPHAALAILWKPLQRQVRLEGPVEQLSPEESDAYFATRSRGSQLGAWASRQSEAIPDREWLEARLGEFEATYPDAGPRPPHWGGFVLRPSVIEFWEGRPNRLHDREVFTRGSDGAWHVRRLSP